MKTLEDLREHLGQSRPLTKETSKARLEDLPTI
jgi:hypothetical protein